MHVWLVRDLEPIPSDEGARRQMRPAMLAQALVDAGHSVRWITSSFDHYLKRQRFPMRQEIAISEKFAISVLPGRGYRRNVSVDRIAHNRDFASQFLCFAKSLAERPDLIVTHIPTTESAAAIVRYGLQNDIATCIEIVDLWPDFFPNMLPQPFRWLGRLAVGPLDRQVRFACMNADGLVGISSGYLAWGLNKAGRHQSILDGVFPLGFAPAPTVCKTAAQDLLAGLGVPPDKRIIAFIGSWGRTYDLQLLYDTAVALQTRDDIAFVVAGSGDQSGYMGPRFARLSNVITPGWITPDQIAAVLKHAEIGILPYTRVAPQGLPNKVFEYLAYGTYQIATLEGELAEFYEQTGAGHSLGSWDPAIVASSITKTLADPIVPQARETRRALFEKSYSHQIIYPRLVDHLELVASNGNRTPLRGNAKERE